jgi:hypothetical protein|tara:strand:- start:382 stop:615 length:234 start_codon:yes stop_codon:yes gene_type:complete
MTDVVMIQDQHSKRVVFQAKTEQAIKFISNGLVPRYKGEQRDINKSLAYNFYCQLVNNDFKVVVCQVMRGGQYHGSA